jgi:uncharacterized protein YcbX
MATMQNVGSLAGLWRFPVKSMQGEQVTEAEVGPAGMLGDRAYALIDGETGKVVSAKSVRLFPGLFGCHAAFVEPPRAPAAMPAVRIELADGTVVRSDSPDADRVLSSHFGRDVTLARAAPADYTIDLYQPDVEGAGTSAHRDQVVAVKLGAAMFRDLGLESPVPAEAFFDAFPMSVLTTSTLRRLSELRPESRFVEPRFRMNVIVGTSESGFVENGWVGSTLAIGDGLRLRVKMLDSRCVMTTLAQPDLPQDIEVLRTLIEHNRLSIGGRRTYPCAGVYAVVEVSGTMRVGDAVALA